MAYTKVQPPPHDGRFAWAEACVHDAASARVDFGSAEQGGEFAALRSEPITVAGRAPGDGDPFPLRLHQALIAEPDQQRIQGA